MFSHTNTWALVLAAGQGSRLSTLRTVPSGITIPKQFCSLHDGPSLLDEALCRARAVTSSRYICSIVAAQHCCWWETALYALPAENIIVQPGNRGTAHGILLPLLTILERDPNAQLLVLPSDHYVRDEAILGRSLQRAAEQLRWRHDELLRPQPLGAFLPYAIARKMRGPMLGWLHAHHRRQILKHPFPESWNAILERNVAHWKFLDDAERVHLRSLVQVFVAEKQWEGCGGLELTDEIRVTIAGLACLLLLGLDHMLYSNVKTICVYSSTVVAPGQRSAVSSGITMQGPGVPIYGQSILRGPVVLVWDAVLRGAVHPERGHNVVYHEFAHKLDMLDGCVDGTPPLADRAQYERWIEVCTREYDMLRRCASKGKRTFLDAYGGTNPGEFFAVITEYFFDKPLQMKRHHPELYSLLQEFYCQDPAARAARHSPGHPDSGNADH